MDSKKQWLDYSEDEQKAILAQIGQGLKDNDLTREVKIIERQQVVFKLKQAAGCRVYF